MLDKFYIMIDWNQKYKLSLSKWFVCILFRKGSNTNNNALNDEIF